MQPNENLSSKRGGAREGAGRKRVAEKRYMFSAPADIVEVLEAIQGSKSSFIVEALRFYIKNSLSK